jgi:surface carbohydrate biosynthesis protein
LKVEKLLAKVKKDITMKKPVLLMPVENQVRELDARLLLACVAARRGLTSIIGPKRKIESHVASFPRGIYLSKSLRIAQRNFFSITRRLGHEIVAWDEEALVHLPPETYFTRRLSPVGMEHVSHMFAWGEENVELWRQYSKLPSEIPIHATGNPRIDLLRPDMQDYYKKEAEEICKAYGDFILINTNFNHVNAFMPAQNLFQPVKKEGEAAQFGQAARGMTREYAEGFREHKQAVFEDFQQFIPEIEAAFPEHTIVVRPHPTENQEIYQKIAARCQRVQVTNEGNVVPWLMAAKVLIHNGCTTGVEAYVMRVPAVSYRKTVNDYYDDGFYKLPNRLSYQCFDFEELRTTLERILLGEFEAADGEDRNALIDYFLAGREGPLACERMVDVLDRFAEQMSQSPGPGPWIWLSSWYKATRRRVKKAYRAWQPGSLKSSEFERHRYPGITADELAERIARFQEVLGDNAKLKLHQIHKMIFKISA